MLLFNHFEYSVSHCFQKFHVTQNLATNIYSNLKTFKLKSNYVAHLKDSGNISSFLPFIFKILGLFAPVAMSFDLSKWQIDEFDVQGSAKSWLYIMVSVVVTSIVSRLRFEFGCFISATGCTPIL
jgi:hypothetical protein